MKASSAVTFVILAASANSILCTPVPSSSNGSNGSQLAPRVNVAAVVDDAARAAGWMLEKLRLGPTVRKGWLKAVGLTPEVQNDLFKRIGTMDIEHLPDETIRYLYKTVGLKQGNNAGLAVINGARDAAINALADGAGGLNEIKLLRSLAKAGDTEAANALKAIKWSPKEIETFGLGSIVDPSRITPAKVVVGAVGGTIAVGLLAAAGITAVAATQASISSMDTYPTIADGAIPEADQQQMLATIEQQPESYSRIMDQIRQYEGITPSEIALFEAADPAKKQVKRSLSDLD